MLTTPNIEFGLGPSPGNIFNSIIRYDKGKIAFLGRGAAYEMRVSWGFFTKFRAYPCLNALVKKKWIFLLNPRRRDNVGVVM